VCVNQSIYLQWTWSSLVPLCYNPNHLTGALTMTRYSSWCDQGCLLHQEVVTMIWTTRELSWVTSTISVKRAITKASKLIWTKQQYLCVTNTVTFKRSWLTRPLRTIFRVLSLVCVNQSIYLQWTWSSLVPLCYNPNHLTGALTMTRYSSWCDQGCLLHQEVVTMIWTTRELSWVTSTISVKRAITKASELIWTKQQYLCVTNTVTFKRSWLTRPLRTIFRA